MTAVIVPVQDRYENEMIKRTASLNHGHFLEKGPSRIYDRYKE
jgi:hypothetical protein